MLICAVWSGGDRRTGPCIIVCMAKKLGIHTLAEGVETSAQVRFLRSIGCEKIQGYYYGRLMPYEEIQQHYGAHYPIESAQETKLYRSKRANAIHNIREVDGFPCTLYLQYAVGYASETRSIEGLLRLLVEQLEEAQQSRLGASIYIGDRIAFDREKFDHMDERVYMSDPETYDLVYINEAACRDLHHRCHQHCHARGKSVRRHPENALENQLGARCRPHLHF